MELYVWKTKQKEKFDGQVCRSANGMIERSHGTQDLWNVDAHLLTANGHWHACVLVSALTPHARLAGVLRLV